MGNKRFRFIFSIFAFFSWLVAVPDSAETRLNAVHGQRWVNKNVITYSYDILLYIYLQNITLPTIQEIYDTIYLKWYEDTVKYMCNMILSTYKPQYNTYTYAVYCTFKRECHKASRSHSRTALSGTALHESKLFWTPILLQK